MHKCNYIIICSTIALAICISCSTDLKFDLPPVDPLLAIQSFVDPDNDFQLTVTMAKPIQEENNIQMDRNCLVNIYENDLFFARLNLDSSRFIIGEDVQRFLRFYIDTGLVFSETKDYKVEIDYPGFEIVTASTIKPNSVKIRNISFKHVISEMPDWYYNTPSFNQSNQITRDTSLIEFKITFDDPFETMNYYRIGVKLLTEIYHAPLAPYFDRKIQYASLDYPDPCFMKVSYESDYPIYSGWGNPIIYDLLINDLKFNGKEQSINILVPGDTAKAKGAKYIIYLYTMSEDYYKYMLDRWRYFKTEDDPFAEPIKFYSNSSNNCGIFAISSMDVDTIQF